MAKSGWLGWLLVVVALVAIAGAIATELHRPGQPRRARLAADQGTIAAMRSAVRIYYQQHQAFPDHPGRYVNPSPPDFQCANIVYVYSSTTGEIRILSANTATDCP